MERRNLIDKLEENGCLEKAEWIKLFSGVEESDCEYAAQKARKIADHIYGKQIYVRGLIEFTNYCKNNCYYCGIRCGNEKAERYRLTLDDILRCCHSGYQLGFRTFVLQGGEDAFFSDEKLITIIQAIRREYPDCAITLSIGEREEESFRKLFEAGANRYLLRHETALETHYSRLHPEQMSLSNRKACLRQLKQIGFQTGCGMMVGSPGQTAECLAEDMLFINELHPQMVGVGPFIPHKDTPFAKETQGDLKLTLFLLSLIRLMEKNVLLPATTALATIHPKGRELGILAGANVVMPNLSPLEVREKYTLYNNKKCTGDEASEAIQLLKERMRNIGYEIISARGDYIETQ